MALQPRTCTKCMFLLLTMFTFVSSQEERILTYSLYEETPSNTFIADIRQGASLREAFEPDVFSTLRYAILPQSSQYSSYFVIDEVSSVLRTVGKIDRDEICEQKTQCPIRLDITIQPREYFRIIKIVINIEDTNDNPPNFVPGHYTRAIAENTPPGASFTIPTAEDPDSPKFGVKRYDLVSGAPQFALKVTNNSDASVDLHLVLKETVDRETRELYRVVVAAYDGGPQANSGFLTVDVTITDINDNSPRFDNQTYEVTVREDVAKDIIIIRLRARDADAGVNGRVVYSLAPKTLQEHGDMFAINNSTGELSVKGSLDFEQHEVYNLGVNARDQNPESLAALAKVIVHVQDVNDHAPQITINALTDTGHVEISEGEPVGSFVAHISATDPDSKENGAFICSMDSSFFTLEKMFEAEYKVTTTRTLDRETTPSYDLTFVCEDQGTPALTSTAHIAVSILDENDNPPVFSKQSYSAILAENNDIGAFIAQVNATDADSEQNGMIEYRPFGDAVRYISVNPISGDVTARVSFDYEEADTLEFFITATDHGAEPFTATATLIVKLTDMDDEAPQFSLPEYVFDVYENLPLGTEVGQVSATDADSPPYNQFSFSLDPAASDTDAFVVEPKSGRVFTRQELDREEKSQYRLVVRAISKDSTKMISTTNVVIHIADKNDNAPQVMFPNSHNDTVHIRNRRPVGDKVAQIVAMDLDIGINSQLTYTVLDGNDRDYFTMNEETGMILIKSSLEDLKDELFQLSIEVKDSGNPQHRVETVLNIVVNTSVPNSIITSQNLTIVVSVAVVSAIIAVVLIGAIVKTRRQDRERRKRRHLAYSTSGEQKVVVMEQGRVDTPSISEIKQNKDDPAARKEVTFSKHIDLQDEQPPKYPALDKSADSSYSLQYTTNRGGGNMVTRPVGRTGSSGKTAAYYPSVHQLALNHPRPGHPHSGSSQHHDSSIDGSPDDLQHCPNKEADSDSTNSAALSITDSGRGSNEDTNDSRPGIEADHAHPNKDGIVLRPPLRKETANPRESFKTRLSGVVQMQSDHAQLNLMRPAGTVSTRTHSDRLNNSSHERLKGTATFNPNIAAHTRNGPAHNGLSSTSCSSSSSSSSSKPTSGSKHQPVLRQPREGYASRTAPQCNNNKDRYLGNGTMNNSYIEEESESEWSDEDREYVYYVNANASHV